MSTAKTLPEMVARRQAIQRELDELGDFWSGTLNQGRVKCGKPNCRCARPGDPGHPRWIVTRRVAGKTRSRSVPAAALETTRERVEKSHRFRELTREWADLSSRICEEYLKHGEPVEPEKRGRWSKRSKPKSSRI